MFRKEVYGIAREIVKRMYFDGKWSEFTDSTEPFKLVEEEMRAMNYELSPDERAKVQEFIDEIHKKFKESLALYNSPKAKQTGDLGLGDYVVFKDGRVGVVRGFGIKNVKLVPVGHFMLPTGEVVSYTIRIGFKEYQLSIEELREVAKKLDEEAGDRVYVNPWI